MIVNNKKHIKSQLEINLNAIKLTKQSQSKGVHLVQSWLPFFDKSLSYYETCSQRNCFYYLSVENRHFLLVSNNVADHAP